MTPAEQVAAPMVFRTANDLTLMLFGRSFVAPTHWPASATFVYRTPGEQAAAHTPVRVERPATVVALALGAVGRSGSRAAEIFEAVRHIRPETTRVQIGSALGRLVATKRVRRQDGLYFVNEG